MSSAYIRKAMGLFHSLVPILFFTSSVSVSPTDEQAKKKRAQIAALPHSHFAMELVWYGSFRLDMAFEYIDCRIVKVCWLIPSWTSLIFPQKVMINWVKCFSEVHIAQKEWAFLTGCSLYQCSLYFWGSQTVFLVRVFLQFFIVLSYRTG